MYRLHKVYCANPWELEAERRAFYDVVGEFNERDAMNAGILYVPVGLGNTRDKRSFQYAVSENIRECRHYLQLFDTAPGEGWGVPERNFERDYCLAIECSSNPALPMHEVAVLAKKPAILPPGITAGTEVREFTELTEFRAELLELLERWLANLTAPERAHAAP
jgi:hypothetical protein